MQTTQIEFPEFILKKNEFCEDLKRGLSIISEGTPGELPERLPVETL